MNAVSEMLSRYELITGEALAVAKAAPVLDAAGAHEVLDMASRYVSDAAFFKQQGDELRALAALSYAHGWLDCGARMKFYKVTDDRLFTIDAD